MPEVKDAEPIVNNQDDDRPVDQTRNILEHENTNVALVKRPRRK